MRRRAEPGRRGCQRGREAGRAAPPAPSSTCRVNVPIRSRAPNARHRIPCPAAGSIPPPAWSDAVRDPDAARDEGGVLAPGSGTPDPYPILIRSLSDPYPIPARSLCLRPRSGRRCATRQSCLRCLKGLGRAGRWRAIRHVSSRRDGMGWDGMGWRPSAWPSPRRARAPPHRPRGLTRGGSARRCGIRRSDQRADAARTYRGRAADGRLAREKTRNRAPA
jgi:hypothetical protein